MTTNTIKGPAQYAPPLTKAKLIAYKLLIDGLPGSSLKDALSVLYTLATEYQKRLVDNPENGDLMAKLAIEVADAIDPHVPWDEELLMYQKLFDTQLNNGVREVIDYKDDKQVVSNVVSNQAAYDLNNAARHLLWYAEQLARGRQPPTCDKL